MSAMFQPLNGGSEEEDDGEDFQILSMHFRFFVIMSPWKGRGLSFQKLESPSPKNALC